jgi:hypothetical protein
MMKFNKTFAMLACASTISLSTAAIAQDNQAQGSEAASGGQATALTMGVTAAVVAAGVLIVDNAGSDLNTFEPSPIEPVDPETPATSTTGTTTTTGTSGTDGTNNTSATGTTGTR